MGSFGRIFTTTEDNAPFTYLLDSDNFTDLLQTTSAPAEITEIPDTSISTDTDIQDDIFVTKSAVDDEPLFITNPETLDNDTFLISVSGDSILLSDSADIIAEAPQDEIVSNALVFLDNEVSTSTTIPEELDTVFINEASGGDGIPDFRMSMKPSMSHNQLMLKMQENLKEDEVSSNNPDIGTDVEKPISIQEHSINFPQAGEVLQPPIDIGYLPPTHRGTDIKHNIGKQSIILVNEPQINFLQDPVLSPTKSLVSSGGIQLPPLDTAEIQSFQDVPDSFTEHSGSDASVTNAPPEYNTFPFDETELFVPEEVNIYNDANQFPLLSPDLVTRKHVNNAPLPSDSQNHQNAQTGHSLPDLLISSSPENRLRIEMFKTNTLGIMKDNAIDDVNVESIISLTSNSGASFSHTDNGVQFIVSNNNLGDPVGISIFALADDSIINRPEGFVTDTPTLTTDSATKPMNTLLDDTSYTVKTPNNASISPLNLLQETDFVFDDPSFFTPPVPSASPASETLDSNSEFGGFSVFQNGAQSHVSQINSAVLEQIPFPIVNIPFFIPSDIAQDQLNSSSSETFIPMILFPMPGLMGLTKNAILPSSIQDKNSDSPPVSKSINNMGDSTRSVLGNLINNEVTFRLTDPEIIDIGQPQFIAANEGVAGPAEVLSLSTAQVAGVGEPVIISVSDTSVTNIQQQDTPATRFQEVSTPVIVPDITQSAGPDNVRLGQLQFVDQTIGQPQVGVPLSVSRPQLNSVSQPLVISVSQPQILSVSQQQAPQESHVTVTQPDETGNLIASQINQQSFPSFSSQGGLQVVSAPSLGSHISNGDVRIVNNGLPQFLGSSHGNTGSNQVKSVIDPQVSSVSNPQTVPFLQHEIGETSKGIDDNTNIVSLSPVFQTSIGPPNFFGTSLPVISQNNVGDVPVEQIGEPSFVSSSPGLGVPQVVSISDPQIQSISQPQTVSVSQPQLTSFDFSEKNRALNFEGDLGVPLPAIASQTAGGSVVTADLVSSISIPDFGNVGVPLTSTSSQTAGGSVVTADLVSSNSIPDFGSVGVPLSTTPFQEQSQTHGGAVVPADLISSNSLPDFSSGGVPLLATSLQGQSPTVQQSQPSAGSVVAADLASSHSIPAFGNIGVPLPATSLQEKLDPVLQSSHTPGGSVTAVDLVSISLSPDLGNIGVPLPTTASKEQLDFNQNPQTIFSPQSSDSSVITAEFVGSSSSPDFNLFKTQEQRLDDEHLHLLSQQDIGSSVISADSALSSFQVNSPQNVNPDFSPLSEQTSIDNQLGSNLLSVSKPQIVQTEQDFLSSLLTDDGAQLDNNFSPLQDNVLQANPNSPSLESISFIGQSTGDASDSQLISLSEPQIVSISQPELLHSSFSSADVQDNIGLSLPSTSPQVKTPDMGSLPLADSSGAPLSSSSPAFPPFPGVPAAANEQLE
ncbi:hypothetical protein SK128_025388 [Halocaridina rubra]|uniref:Uncharacterized protein n=1 Tax=Halocaridina rubra TaxID=373956 RepID=A0AAN8XH53_HALRR